jgi:predicted Zn-dependent protease
MYKITAYLSFMWLLSGCVDLSPYQQNPAPVEGRNPAIYGDSAMSQLESERERTTTTYRPQKEKAHQATAADPIVLALVGESKKMMLGGDIPAAIATLERGVRIRPRNPLLWAQLAELRLKQGNVVLAENLARKSLALIATNTDRPLQVRNWQLIATSLGQQGKTKEASFAAQKARQFQNNLID